MISLRPRRTRSTELDLTPVMDVIFILLIFFIVASAFAITDSVFMPPLQYGGRW